MRRILIPTDFSDHALNALKYALKLFKHDICKFYIMHAYQDEIYADQTLMSREILSEISRIIEKKSLKQLDRILKLIKKSYPNSKHSYKILAINNLLIEEANKIVNDENIDIIIMGTRGQTNDRMLSLGSNTLQVLKHVQCPVLAIPENYNGTHPSHILFPSNYLIPYKRRELKLLCELAAPYSPIIDMLYISKIATLSKRQERNLKLIEKELHKTKINFKTVNAKNITNTIYSYIKENNIDMLVMVNTRHSFLEFILFKSTIDKISLNIDIPFLALQNLERN